MKGALRAPFSFIPKNGRQTGRVRDCLMQTGPTQFPAKPYTVSIIYKEPKKWRIELYRQHPYAGMMDRRRSREN